METIGLDNGILIRSRMDEVKIPKRIEPCYCKGFNDIAYWRRYWGLRNDILDIILPREEIKLADFGSAYPLTREDLIKIYSVVRNCYSRPSNFREACSDYWWWGYWHYFKFNIWVGIKYLRNIKWAIRHFNEVEVFFYDSY